MKLQNKMKIEPKIKTKHNMVESLSNIASQPAKAQHLIDSCRLVESASNHASNCSSSSSSSRIRMNHRTSFAHLLPAVFCLLLLATNVAAAIETIVEPPLSASTQNVASSFDYSCGIDKDNSNPGALQLRYSPIGLQLTDDVTHQLMTRIFAIFLKEVLHYSNVTLIPIKSPRDVYNPNYEEMKLMNFFSLLHYHPDFRDMGMINMALWMPPIGYSPGVIQDAGSSMPTGRFGWFVPKTLIKVSPQRSLDLLHYKVFWEPGSQDYKSYLMDEQLLVSLKQKADAVYTSPKCANIHCVTLLAQYQSDTAFVVHHIKEMGSYVNIIWLGDEFQQTVKDIYKAYHENETYDGRRFIVLHWVPSDIIEDDIEFRQLTMPYCEEYKSLQESQCKYEMTPILKYFSSNLDNDANKPLLYALRNFYVHDQNLTSLYGDLKAEISDMSTASTLNDVYNTVACKWLKKDGYKSLISTDPEVTLYIGGIFPITETSRGHENLVHAVNRAVDAINNSTAILSNYNFQVLLNDGKCRPDLVMKAFIHFFNLPKVVGILGPACSETVEPIAGISKHTNLAVISYSAEGASFVDRHAYPYFFRTIGSNFQYEDVYIALMRRLRWRRVAALTEDGQKYTEYISHMEASMKQLNLDLIMNKKFLSDVSAADMNKHLLDLRQKHAKIIIADIHNRNAELALCEAFKLGMTAREGYVWFLPPWLSKNWTLLSKSSNNSCSGDELQQAYEGHFSVLHTPFGNSSQRMQENKTIQEWLDAYDSGNRSVSNYIGFAYDAVWAYAIATDRLLKENRDAINSLRTKNVVERFVELIRHTDFEGLSGRVRFGRGGSRITNVDIMQWRHGQFNKVGKFTPKIEGTGSDAYPKGGELELMEKKIEWLSGEDPPGDGTYDCSLAALAEIMGADCDGAAVAFAVVLCILLVVSVSLISFLFWKKRYDSKLKKSAKIMKTFGIDLLSPSRNDTNTLDKWEVPKENVVLNRRLGEGAFGTVYGGEALLNSEGWTAVAVKTLKAGASSEDRIDFLSEADAMKRFDHKNIVKLLGVCLQSEPIYTIMEFMLYGDLKTYLLARRHMVNEKLTDESDISPKRLTSYAMDVARGLQYLAQQKYVHRDLACRNCLVNTQRVVKLGDFGMARPTFESDYYRFNRKGMLPVRWMAPESLALGMFTPASDVWAFGVVVFEIITFGSFPFQGMTNNQVLEFVKKGNSLQVPAGVKPHLEGLMKACWSQEPKKRPTAKEIVEYISNHPRLLTHCLDFPGAAVEMPETESDQLELLPKGRKGTPIRPDSTLDILAQTTPNNNNNNFNSNNFERNRELIDEMHRMNRQSSDDDNDSTSTVDGNYAQHMSTSIDIPKVRTDIRATALSIDAFSPTTPDGYSIMSPLLMHQVSECSDSSQGRLIKKSSSENLQQSSF